MQDTTAETLRQFGIPDSSESYRQQFDDRMALAVEETDRLLESLRALRGAMGPLPRTRENEATMRSVTIAIAYAEDALLRLRNPTI